MDEPSFVEPARPVFFGFRRPQCYNPDVAKKLSFRDASGPQPKSWDTLKVYLRIKPPTDHDHTTDSFLIEDEHTLVTKIPESYTKGKKAIDCRYTFTNIFPEGAQQEEVFNATLRTNLRNFFLGSNYLLFSYGTTSSGKTYTLIGNGANPGLIPRVLLSIFKSIQGVEDSTGTLCPNRGCSVTRLNQGALKANDELKKKIVEANKEKHGSCTSLKSMKSYPSIQLSSDSLNEESYGEMKETLVNEVEVVSLPPEDGVVYSVWISFAEIYNENIYDLLEVYETSRPRKVLKLAYDKDRSTYIKDLHHVCVSSSAEAFKVLMFGKRNMSISATSLNKQSSRSHSIFTIKLLKKPSDNDEIYYQVSSLTICDLAGSERQKKALTMGSRLKESGNINTSLLVLNRCFSIIRDNQLRADKQLVPFRDSKLTQLFQKALTGKEIMTMIVTVNQSEELLEETQHILKSTAIALEIRVKKEPRVNYNRKQSRFSVLCSSYSNASTVPWMSESTVHSSVCTSIKESSQEIKNIACESNAPSVPELLALIESLQEDLNKSKKEVKEEIKKGKLMELKVREEVSSQYKNLMAQMETQHQNQIKQLGRRHEGITKRFEENLERLCKKRKTSVFEDGDDDDDKSPDDRPMLLKKIEILKMDVESAKENYNKADKEAKRLQKANITLHIKLSALETERKTMYDLSKDGDIQGVINYLNKENSEKDSKIEALEGLLEEAREEFNYLTDTVKTLENELSEKDEELSSKYATIEKLELREKTLNDIIESQRREIAGAKQLKDSCDVEDDLASKFLKLSIEYKETTAAFEKLKQEKKEAESKLDQLEAKYDKMVSDSQEVEDLKQNNNNLRSFHQALIDRHNEEVQSLEKEVEILQKDVKSRGKEIETINEELKKKNAEIDALKRIQEDSVVNIEELEEEVKSLKQELKKKEKMFFTTGPLQEEWVSLQSELTKATNERNQMLKDFEALKEQNDSLQKELDEEIRKQLQSADGLKVLLEEKDSLQKELEKVLEEKSEALEGFKTVQKERDSLQKELEKEIEEKVKAVNDFETLQGERESLRKELTKEIEEKNKALVEFESLQKIWNSKQLELEKVIEERNKTVEEFKKIQEERNTKQEELNKAIKEKKKALEEFKALQEERHSKQKEFEKAIEERDKALEDKQKIDLLMLNLKVTKDLRKTEPRLRARPRRTKVESHSFNSDDEAENTNGYQSYDGGETDEDIFFNSKKKAATTVKKKKKTSKKNQLEVPSYNYHNREGEKTSEVESTSPVTRSQSTRRKLFTKSEDTLGDVFGSIECNEDQSQASPCTIMKRTLRTGKNF